MSLLLASSPLLLVLLVLAILLIKEKLKCKHDWKWYGGGGTFSKGADIITSEYSCTKCKRGKTEIEKRYVGGITEFVEKIW